MAGAGEGGDPVRDWGEADWLMVQQYGAAQPVRNRGRTGLARWQGPSITAACCGVADTLFSSPQTFGHTQRKAWQDPGTGPQNEKKPQRPEPVGLLWQNADGLLPGASAANGGREGWT